MKSCKRYPPLRVKNLSPSKKCSKKHSPLLKFLKSLPPLGVRCLPTYGYSHLFLTFQSMIPSKTYLQEELNYGYQRGQSTTSKGKAVPISNNLKSSFPTRLFSLTVSVIVGVRGKWVRLELRVTC